MSAGARISSCYVTATISRPAAVLCSTASKAEGCHFIDRSRENILALMSHGASEIYVSLIVSLFFIINVPPMRKLVFILERYTKHVIM